jgi:hypothetical protein
MYYGFDEAFPPVVTYSDILYRLHLVAFLKSKNVTIDRTNKGLCSNEGKHMSVSTSLIYYRHKSCATCFYLSRSHYQASCKNYKPSCSLNWLPQYGCILYDVIIIYLDRITTGFYCCVKTYVTCKFMFFKIIDKLDRQVYMIVSS